MKAHPRAGGSRDNKKARLPAAFPFRISVSGNRRTACRYRLWCSRIESRPGNPPLDSVDRGARALFEKMEHLDPTPEGDFGWDGLSDYDREFYLACATAVIDSLQQFSDDHIVHRRTQVSE